MRNHGQVNLREVAREALEERGFKSEFSPAVERAASKVQEPDFSSLKIPDLSHLPWSSIDNDESKDLDQIECVKVEGRTTRVLVGIADVASLVPKNSEIDLHAQHNTTSIYTGVKTFPMLPERLSNDLTSLNENEKRLAMVIETKVAEDGEITSFNVYPAIVQNKAQLTYNAVSTWLKDYTPPDSEITQRMLAKIRSNPVLQEQIKIQDEIAQTLREKRREEGSLDFETPQLRANVKQDGHYSLGSHRSNRATQLIEELMVSANQAVDEFLQKKGMPVLQRVVKEPRNWPRMVALAEEYGCTLPGEPDGQALQKFLAEQKRRDPDRFPDLSLAMIKLMGRGEYDAKAPNQDGTGHFGLAVTHYAHSTAPNRRYPDLITQRMLHAAVEGKPSPYSMGELRSLAAHCTEQEGEANKAERHVHKSIAAVELANHVGEKFRGFISGASEKGVWVRVVDPPVEGKVMGRTGDLKVGQEVEVKLVGTDPYRGFIDFEVVGRKSNRSEHGRGSRH